MEKQRGPRQNHPTVTDAQQLAASIPHIVWHQDRGSVDEVRDIVQETFPHQWKQAGDEMRAYMEKKGIWGMDGRIEAARREEQKTGDTSTHRMKITKWLDEEFAHMKRFTEHQTRVGTTPKSRDWPHVPFPRNLAKRTARFQEEKLQGLDGWEYEQARATIVHDFWYKDVRVARARDLALQRQQELKTKQQGGAGGGPQNLPGLK